MSANHEINGIGEYQKMKAYSAQRVIFKALYDGQWHRNMELKDKTKLSSRTLNKHLNQLIEMCLIEKMVDTESGKYPVPVLYKAKPALLAYMKSNLLREDFSEKVDAMLAETKDPLVILEVIHDFSQRSFMHILEQIKLNKNIMDEQIDFLEEVFLWSSYKSFTFDLIEACRRKIDTLDLNQLLISQAKRRKLEAQKY